MMGVEICGKWSDLTYILRLEPTACAAGLYVGNKKRSQEWPLLMTCLVMHINSVFLLHTARETWSFPGVKCFPKASSVSDLKKEC